MPNDQEIEKNSRRKKGRRNKSKKKKAAPMGNPDEDMVIVEFLESNNDWDRFSYWE